MDVAKIVAENTQLEGIDINASLFPKAHPSNVHFSTGSIVSLPEDWTGTFDLVHQRLLIGSLQSNEWEATISEIYRVLKPGGTFACLEFSRVNNPLLSR